MPSVVCTYRGREILRVDDYVWGTANGWAWSLPHSPEGLGTAELVAQILDRRAAPPLYATVMNILDIGRVAARTLDLVRLRWSVRTLFQHSTDAMERWCAAACGIPLDNAGGPRAATDDVFRRWRAEPFWWNWDPRLTRAAWRLHVRWWDDTLLSLATRAGRRRVRRAPAGAPIAAAAASGDLEALRHLIEVEGGDPNQPVWYEGRYGTTVRHALAVGSSDFLRDVLALHADVEARISLDDMPALEQATTLDQRRVLLDAGANPNFLEQESMRYIDMLQLEGEVEDSLILLLSRGVSVRAQVRHGSFWPNGDRRDVYATALERKQHRLARWIEDNIPDRPIVDIVRPPLPDDAARADDRGQTGTPFVR